MIRFYKKASDDNIEASIVKRDGKSVLFQFKVKEDDQELNNERWLMTHLKKFGGKLSKGESKNGFMVYTVKLEDLDRDQITSILDVKR